MNWIYICYVEESRPPLWSSGQSSWLRNRNILCFLWGTNWIYICYVEESRPPLWSSGQSSWLQIQRSWFDFWRYHIFWEVAGLECGPLSLVTTTEELLGRKSSGSGLENQEYGRRGAAALTTRHPSDFLRNTGSGMGSTLSPVNTIEQLLWRKVSVSSLEIWEYGRRDPLHWPRDTLFRKSWH
jgi:hypothetical protein